MDALDTQIASRLEQMFVRRGFAEPSVAELRDASEVSLRTLYRRFPSREAMVVGALEHRHRRYLAFLAEGEPEPGAASIAQLFDRLESWMREQSPGGCLFVNALAAHPENAGIRTLVDRHKQEIRSVLARRAGRPDAGDALFLLHEGVAFSWRLLGAAAVNSAREAAMRLLESEGS